MTEAFIKHDAEKLPLDLLPVDVLEQVAKVLAHGAKKYSPDNWVKCPSLRRYYAAALRHLFAWAKGEDLDPESGLPHLAHASCCLLFLLGLVLEGRAKDDRRVCRPEGVDKGGKQTAGGHGGCNNKHGRRR